MNNFERGWLSAFVDSEGCLYLSKKGRSYGDSFQAACDLANTNKDMIMKAKCLVGGYLSIRRNSGNHKDLYFLRITGNGLRKMLAQISLVCKENQRLLLIEAQGLMAQRNRLRWGTLHSLRLHEIEKEFRFLNHRGKFVLAERKRLNKK